MSQPASCNRRARSACDQPFFSRQSLIRPPVTFSVFDFPNDVRRATWPHSIENFCLVKLRLASISLFCVSQTDFLFLFPNRRRLPPVRAATRRRKLTEWNPNGYFPHSFVAVVRGCLFHAVRRGRNPPSCEHARTFLDEFLPGLDAPGLGRGSRLGAVPLGCR